jgi:hypothetical protein
VSWIFRTFADSTVGDVRATMNKILGVWNRLLTPLDRLVVNSSTELASSQ